MIAAPGPAWMERMQAYLDTARLGKNEWWRTLLALLLILFLWLIVGSLPGLFLLFWFEVDGDPSTSFNPNALQGVDLKLYFTALMLGSVCFLAAIALAVHWIHGRPLRSLVTPAARPDWSRLLQGFLAWLLIAGLLSLLESSAHPGRYRLSFEPGAFLTFLPLALVLVPVQTSAEELFFRGYLLQGLGLRFRNPWLLSLISGLVFGLPHLVNPEAQFNLGLMGVYYVFTGGVLAYVTLRDGSLELALGLHAANNLFTTLVANYSVTVMPSPAIFTVREVDALFGVFVPIAGLALFAWLFLGPLRRRPPEETGSTPGASG